MKNYEGVFLLFAGAVIGGIVAAWLFTPAYMELQLLRNEKAGIPSKRDCGCNKRKLATMPTMALHIADDKIEEVKEDAQEDETRN